MEETHQDVLLKQREDMMRAEQKHISRAVADMRSVEEEKQEALIRDLKQKEQERIQAAVDTERKIMESQYGSVTQLQQVSLGMKLVPSAACLDNQPNTLFFLVCLHASFACLLFVLRDLIIVVFCSIKSL